MAGRVFWSEKEWDDLAARVFPIWLKSPGGSLLDIVQRAQEQLPADRRRQLKTMGLIEPLLTRLAAMAQQMKSDAAEVQPLRDKLAMEPEDIELWHKYRDRFLRMISVADLRDRFTFEELLAEVDDADLFFAAADRLNKALKALQVAHSFRAAPTIPGRVTHDRQQEVVVMGALPGQIESLKQAMPTIAWRRLDPEKLTVRQVPTRADLYVIWTRFVSHAACDVLKKVAGDRVIEVRGGLYAIADAVEEKLGTTRSGVQASVSLRG